MESYTENNNNLSDVASTCSNLSFPSFSVGSYVMASWKNNYEYLAEVLGHRKRQGELIEYKLKYIWDKVIEWSPSTKMREAAEFEIDFVLNLCKQQQSGNLDPEKIKGKGNPENQKKEEEPPTTGGKQKRVKKTEIINSNSNGSIVPNDEINVAENDMVYDKSVAQFHEACKRRRILKRNCPDDSVMNKSLPVEIDSAKNTKNESKEINVTPAKKTKQMNKSLDFSKSQHVPTIKPPDQQQVSSPLAANPKPPVKNYQCPYCPRQLRQEKLLRAHIQNYHENDDTFDPKIPCSLNNSNNQNSSYCQKTSANNNRSPETSFSLKTTELKGYVNCASCRQSFVSLKLDPGLYLQCNICLTWSHRKCIGLSSSSNYPYDKYNSFKLFNSKWSCIQCSDAIKKNSQLFKYDWITNNFLNSDRITSQETTNIGNICQNGIPLTPPSTPPISFDSGSMILPNSLDVLRNGKSVLSTYRKKVLSDSASLLNFGHTIHRLFPAISKSLNDIQNSSHKFPDKSITNNYPPPSENFLVVDAPPHHQPPTLIDDESNIGWMDFENMAVDVLSAPTGNTKTHHSSNDNSGGLFSLELVPSDVLKDLFHPDSSMPDDINELLVNASNHTADADYANLLSFTPNKNFPVNQPKVEENSRIYPPEQSPNSIASILKSSMNQDNFLSSPIKSRDPTTTSATKLSNNTGQVIICDTNPALLNQTPASSSPPLLHQSQQQHTTNESSCQESTMAFYNSVFEKLTGSNTNLPLDDEIDECCQNLQPTNVVVTTTTTNVTQPITSDSGMGIEHTVNLSEHAQRELADALTLQVNPLERLLDKFEETLKKMTRHVDNLEAAYREDMLQQTINMNNDNMYSKSVSDVMSYASRLEDYAKLDCLQSSSDEELLVDHHSYNANTIGRRNSIKNSTITRTSLNPEGLHHFVYSYPLKKAQCIDSSEHLDYDANDDCINNNITNHSKNSSKFPISSSLSRRSRSGKLKLTSRLYSLQMAKRDSLYNKQFGFGQIQQHYHFSSSVTSPSVGLSTTVSTSSTGSAAVLKSQNRNNPGNIKKGDSSLYLGSMSSGQSSGNVVVGNSTGTNSVLPSRNRCFPTTISPLVSANINNNNNSNNVGITRSLSHHPVTSSKNNKRPAYPPASTYHNDHQQHFSHYRRNIV